MKVWRRRAARPDVSSRTDAVVTGVILARLESAVDRLEAVYQQWLSAPPAERPAQPPAKEDDGG